jgi:hypothetical protein
MSEETYLAFPTERQSIQPATKVKSTLIMSSLRTLREAGLFDDYAGHLPPEAKDTILELASPSWLPIEIALAHYGACDQLGLSPSQVTEMAQRVSTQAQGTFLGVAIAIARGIGVTPWTVLGRARSIWERAWVGGGMAGFRIGAQEMRIEVAGWPCARIPYCRYALRGILLGVVSMLSKEAYARELTELQTDLDVAYRVAWR